MFISNPLTISALAITTGALAGPVTTREANANPFRFRLPRAFDFDSHHFHALSVQQRSLENRSPQILPLDDIASDILQSNALDPQMAGKDVSETDPVDPINPVQYSTAESPNLDPTGASTSGIQPNLEFLCVTGEEDQSLIKSGFKKVYYRRQSLPTSSDEVKPKVADSDVLSTNTDDSDQSSGITPNIQLNCVQLAHGKNQSSILKVERKYQA